MPNRLKAKIHFVEFLGDVYRYHLKAGALEIFADHGGSIGHGAGDIIDVGWRQRRHAGLPMSDAAFCRRPRAARNLRRKQRAPWLLMAPALVIVLVFFGIPTLYMARMSFNLHFDQRLYVPGFTFEHYGNLFSNPLFTSCHLDHGEAVAAGVARHRHHRLWLCHAGLAEAIEMAAAVHRPGAVPAADFGNRHHLRLVDVLPEERPA